LVTLGAMPMANAIEFTFLGQALQQTFETCVLNEIAGLEILSGLFFGGLRVLVGAYFIWEVFQAWQKRQSNQKNREEIEHIVGGTFAVVIAGVFDPLLAGPGCAGGATPSGPVTFDLLHNLFLGVIHSVHFLG
jgi:hypothetical protein